MKKHLLDLFCGAGGASKGYADVGFEVIGADIRRQPHYPYKFVHSDWLDALNKYKDNVDVIHASPPCQRYSSMSSCRPGVADKYPDLVARVREELQATGLPYVIENVVGAPLLNPVTLCGFMFGLELYRHRLFETNFHFPQPRHRYHTMPTSRAGHWYPGTIMSIAGHFAPVSKGREIMEIDWMTAKELAEAIPPAYTQYVGGFMQATI